MISRDANSDSHTINLFFSFNSLSISPLDKSWELTKSKMGFERSESVTNLFVDCVIVIGLSCTPLVSKLLLSLSLELIWLNFSSLSDWIKLWDFALKAGVAGGDYVMNLGREEFISFCSLLSTGILGEAKTLSGRLSEFLLLFGLLRYFG